MISVLQRRALPSINAGTIVVDDQLHTSVTGIWALGDCIGKGAFTHTAFNDAEIVGASLLDMTRAESAIALPPMLCFVDPPLGRAGLTEEVRKKRLLRADRPAADDGCWSRR